MESDVPVRGSSASAFTQIALQAKAKPEALKGGNATGKDHEI